MVVRTPGAVEMPWAANASAIIVQMMVGQAAGSALAAVLFGEEEPTGRLPITFPNSLNETWLQSKQQYPGVRDDVTWEIDHNDGDVEAAYSEELLVGYRWYDEHQLTPLFPFGHGHGYANWTLSPENFSIEGAVSETSNATISAQLSALSVVGLRGGRLAGGATAVFSTTVQLYVSFPKSAGEPPKVLRGFEKVTAFSGGAVQVSFVLSARDFSFWGVDTADWIRARGNFSIQIGFSSRDIRLRGEVASK
jgi:beta-glucosidase